MKTMTDKKNSHGLTAWWIYFIVIFVLAIIAQLSFSSRGGNKVNDIVFGYYFLLLAPLMIKNLVEQEKIKNYLKKNHPYEWTKTFGSRKINLFLIGFYLSKEDFGDQGLADVKRAYRKFWAFYLFIVLSVPLLWVILRNIR